MGSPIESSGLQTAAPSKMKFVVSFISLLMVAGMFVPSSTTEEVQHENYLNLETEDDFTSEETNPEEESMTVDDSLEHESCDTDDGICTEPPALINEGGLLKRIVKKLPFM